MNSFVNNKAENWIIFGIPILIILSIPLHFIFDFTGNIPIIGFFAPVNESIWEHLKLSFFPIIFWWTIGYFLYYKNYYFKVRTWICSGIISSITSIIIITIFFYTYTGAFGVQFLFLDILSLFLGIVISQILGLYIYKNFKFSDFLSFTLYVLIVLLVILFILFTFYPPHIPLFLDSETEIYGI